MVHRYTKYSPKVTEAKLSILERKSYPPHAAGNGIKVGLVPAPAVPDTARLPAVKGIPVVVRMVVSYLRQE